MKVTLDNLDGLGAVDYSGAIDRSEKLEIARTLNAPSTFKCLLCLAGTTLKTPVRRARLVVAADAGTLLFTGYVTTEPVAIYAGIASEGAVHRLALRAVSDEWLLDKQTPGALTGAALASSGGAVVRGLLGRLAPGAFSATGVLDGPSVGVFEPVAGAAWSAHAGAVADVTYAAYRVLGGALDMAPAGSVTHALSDGDGTLNIAGLRTAAVRELANDVTVSGALEPATFWTEIFLGDGSTTVFNLQGEPAAPSLGHTTLLAEEFSTSALNLQRWAMADPGSHLALGAGGLTLNGGNGLDGQTTLAANDAVEMGGTVVIELRDVMLNAGSVGVLGGLYGGVVAQANCLAGFSVKQAGGNTVLTPMVNGAETGSTATLLAGHAYTLRLHLHCAELLRVRQAFYAMVDSGAGAQVQRFGGGNVDAPLAMVFELRDQGQSSNTPVTILYAGTLPSSFAAPVLCAVNSVQLFGSLGAVSVARTGTAWLHSTDPTTGAVTPRLAGRLNLGLDCEILPSVTGTVTFWPGRQPVPGEYVTVLYRGRRRAVARVADGASLAAEAAGGGSGTSRWLGKVERPSARSSEDCENAAQAILAFASNRAAAVAGSYVTTNPVGPGGDIWPGDVLALNSGGQASSVLVRQVLIEEAGAAPESLAYRIAFANDWAEGLGIRLSEAVAADAVLPEQPLLLPDAAHTLANPAQLTVLAFTGTGAASAITVDAGLDPPAGGGFEVRRHNGGFGTGSAASASGDLVLRSPVRGFSLPRASPNEIFYVRMYDASTPPLYSRESAGIAVNVPM